MIERISSFWTQEKGAVTVDWVVLTAALCGLAIASFASVQAGSRSVGDTVRDYLVETPVEELINVEGG